MYYIYFQNELKTNEHNKIIKTQVEDHTHVIEKKEENNQICKL